MKVRDFIRIMLANGCPMLGMPEDLDGPLPFPLDTLVDQEVLQIVTRTETGVLVLIPHALGSTREQVERDLEAMGLHPKKPNGPNGPNGPGGMGGQGSGSSGLVS